jgi:glycosyltransferase involved in cell wall biosynthesis
MKHIVVTGTRGIPNVMGGVETHCEELYPRVINHNYKVHVIRRKSYVNDGLKEWNGVKLIDIYSPKIKAFEAIVHTFLAIVKAKLIGADIVHIHAIGPALLVPFARLLGLKVVFTSHGPDYNREKWGFIAKFILRLGEKWGTKYANEVIVISKGIDQILRAKYQKNDCHVIPNGVPEPIFQDNDEYFQTIGIERKKYILAMCRIVPEKNLHHLIQAYTKLKEQGKIKDIKLVIAGDSDFEDDYSIRLKKMAKDNDIIMTGFVKGNKLQSLLTHARCYVLPSSHEGLPIGLLEAMSYHLPVIVSNIPAHQELNLFKNCYFQVGNIEDLTRVLHANITTDFKSVEYDMKKYNWDNIADEVCKVYQLCYNNCKNK